MDSCDHENDGTCGSNYRSHFVLSKLMQVIGEYNKDRDDESISPYMVGAFTFICFVIIHLTLGVRGKVYWVYLAHHILTGIGSCVCIYLDRYAELINSSGTPNPLCVIRCEGPLTNLHRLLPSVSWGFGVFELVDGIKSADVSMIIHGVAFISITNLVNLWGHPESIIPMFITEISSIFLAVMKNDFTTEKTRLFLQFLFAVSFMICRLFIAPYIWFQFLLTLYKHDNEVDNCFPKHFDIIVFSFGMLFHILNIFWAIKISRIFVSKLRKLRTE